MDQAEQIGGGHSAPGTLETPLPITPGPQDISSKQTFSPTTPPAGSGTPIANTPPLHAPEIPDSSSGETDKPPGEQARHGSKKRENKSRVHGNWLMGEPQGWVGRKVRSRRNLAIYTISEVYKTGRVKLERNWMTYLTDAQTVRTHYDTVA